MPGNLGWEGRHWLRLAQHDPGHKLLTQIVLQRRLFRLKFGPWENTVQTLSEIWHFVNESIGEALHLAILLRIFGFVL